MALKEKTKQDVSKVIADGHEIENSILNLENAKNILLL